MIRPELRIVVSRSGMIFWGFCRPLTISKYGLYFSPSDMQTGALCA